MKELFSISQSRLVVNSNKNIVSKTAPRLVCHHLKLGVYFFMLCYLDRSKHRRTCVSNTHTHAHLYTLRNWTQPTNANTLTIQESNGWVRLVNLKCRKQTLLLRNQSKYKVWSASLNSNRASDEWPRPNFDMWKTLGNTRNTHTHQTNRMVKNVENILEWTFQTYSIGIISQTKATKSLCYTEVPLDRNTIHLMKLDLIYDRKRRKKNIENKFNDIFELNRHNNNNNNNIVPIIQSIN